MMQGHDSAPARATTPALPAMGDALAPARQALRAERHAEAEALLRARLAAASPGDPSARDAARLLAEALYLAGRHDDALAAADGARRRGWLAPDDPFVAALSGWVLLRRGQARPARQLAARHLRALARAAAPAAPTLQARLLHLRGLCDFRLGRPRAARGALRDAAALFRHGGDPGGAAEALNALGVVEKTAVSLSAAAARFEEALRLHAAHGQPGRRAAALLNLGLVRLKEGDVAAALDALREAHRLAVARDAVQTATRAALALARARLQAGDAAGAADGARAALATARARGWAREEGLALETLGDAALVAGRPDEAERAWDEALAVARAIAPGGDLEAEVRRRQAELRLARGDTVGAVAALRHAVRVASACGERFEEGVALRALAMAHLVLGQWSAADRTVRAALQTLRDLGAALEVARCLLAAATIRHAWHAALRDRAPEAPAPSGPGDRTHRDAAWCYALEAMHAFEALGRSDERARCETLMEALRVAGDGAVPPPPPRAPLGRPRAGEPPFVARAPAMRRVLALTEVAAASDEPVLVTGETGTGKEVVARLVHARGRRARGPFVPVNCAAIPESLFEREFFGHARGAYTGADRDKPGLCEAADGGTLFLDEIGDLPPPMQAKLLRLLQEGTFRRLGETHERRADLRVVAATNADLAALIAQRRFRQDLYYRLQTLELPLPPLRERREDLDDLLALFAGRDPRELFDAEVMRALKAYRWPGNVRELEAMTRRLALLASHGGRVTRAALPPALAAALADRRPRASSDLNLTRHLEEAEKRRIAEALALTGGNRTEAARALGVSRNSLYRKMERLGLPPPA